MCESNNKYIFIVTNDFTFFFTTFQCMHMLANELCWCKIFSTGSNLKLKKAIHSFHTHFHVTAYSAYSHIISKSHPVSQIQREMKGLINSKSPS